MFPPSGQATSPSMGAYMTISFVHMYHVVNVPYIAAMLADSRRLNGTEVHRIRCKISEWRTNVRGCSRSRDLRRLHMGKRYTHPPCFPVSCSHCRSSDFYISGLCPHRFIFRAVHSAYMGSSPSTIPPAINAYSIHYTYTDLRTCFSLLISDVIRLRRGVAAHQQHRVDVHIRGMGSEPSRAR